MNSMYLDMTDNSCTSVFIKNTRIIPTGTTIYAMPVKDKCDAYDFLADKYNIHFIFDDNIPTIDFYAIPRIDIMATDGAGGFLGTLGEISDLNGQAPICYIDNDKNCYVIASDFRDLLNHPDNWRKHAVPCKEITLFSSKEEAMKKHEFVDLSAFPENTS